MKKLFIYAATIGIAASIIYLLLKKFKFTNNTSKKSDEKFDFKTTPKKEEISQNTNNINDMYQAKSESAQAVHERHSEAGSIMKDAYSNIMQDFVEDFSDEKDVNHEGEKRKNVIIDDNSVTVMKEIDSISDKLNDLLK